MIRDFSLERVGKGPAAFDIKKLNATQEHYMQQVPLDQKVEMCLPFLRQAKLIDAADDAVRQQVRQVIEAAAHRIVIAGDILDYAPFFVADAALTWDDKVFEKHLRKPAGATGLLANLRQRLADLEPFDPPTLEANVKEYIQTTGAKLGDVNQALRVATTGKGVGFGTYETLAVLGRARCLARIDRTLSQLSDAVRSQE
jgi:glutamyl-tRNA synthetase